MKFSKVFVLSFVAGCGTSDAVAEPVFNYVLKDQVKNLKANTTDTIEIIGLNRRGQQANHSTGTLFVHTESNQCLRIFSRTANLENGKAIIPVLPLKGGHYPITIVDKERRLQSQVIANITPPPSWVSLNFTGFDYYPAFITGSGFSPFVKSSSDIPLTSPVNLKVYNKRGGIVFSRISDLKTVSTGKFPMSVSTPGMYTAELLVYDLKPSELSGNTNHTTRSLGMKQVSFESISEQIKPVHSDSTTITVLSSTPQEWRSLEWPFGICINNNQFSTDYISTSTLDVQLRWQFVLGATWGRNELTDDAILKDGDAYKWNRIDSTIKQFRARFIKLTLGLPVIPEMMKAVPALQKEYRATLYAMDFMNTKNLPTDDYVRIVNNAITAINNGDDKTTKTAFLVVGNSAHFSTEEAQILLDKIDERFNILSYHWFPKSIKEDLLNDYDKMTSQAVGLLKNKFPDKEFWLGKAGIADSGDEENQAINLVKLYTIGFYNGVSKIFWSNLLDNYKYPWDRTNENSFGLLKSDYSPKISAVSYSLVSNLLAGVVPKKREMKNGLEIFTFTIKPQSSKVGGIMYVVWNNVAKKTSVTLPIELSNRVYAIDAFGAETIGKSVSESGQSIGLEYTVDHVPLFVWDMGEIKK